MHDDGRPKADLRILKKLGTSIPSIQKIENVASCCRNFKKVADHEGVLQSLQILQQRQKRPRIIKDRACHRHCPLIATRAVAPPAARIIKAGFGISRIENPRRGRRYSSGAWSSSGLAASYICVNSRSSVTLMNELEGLENGVIVRDCFEVCQKMSTKHEWPRIAGNTFP